MLNWLDIQNHVAETFDYYTLDNAILLLQKLR